MLITVPFGQDNSGKSIWYTILNADTSVYQARTNTGVVELSLLSGLYGVQVADSILQGRTVLWDVDGEGKVASETFPEIDVKTISGNQTAADNLELFFNGTGYDAANSKIGMATSLGSAYTNNLGQMADAVCDEALVGHGTDGTVGKAISDILDDTGTSGVAISTTAISAIKTKIEEAGGHLNTLLSRIVGTLLGGNHSPQSGDAYSKTLDASGVRDAVGLAEANLDLQIDGLSTFDPTVQDVVVVTNKDKTGYEGTATNMVAEAPSTTDNATAVRSELATELGRIDENVSAAKTLTVLERLAIANQVESQIIDEADSEQVLQAIVDKIWSLNPDFDDLTLLGITTAVRDELERSGGLLSNTAKVSDLASLPTDVSDEILNLLATTGGIVMSRGTGSEIFTDSLTDGVRPSVGIIVRAFVYTSETTVDWTKIKGRDVTNSSGAYTLFLDPGKYEFSLERNGVQVTTVTKIVPEPEGE